MAWGDDDEIVAVADPPSPGYGAAGPGGAPGGSAGSSSWGGGDEVVSIVAAEEERKKSGWGAGDEVVTPSTAPNAFGAATGGGERAEVAAAAEQQEIERAASSGARSPQWVKNAAEAAVEVLKESIPRSPAQVLEMLTPLGGAMHDVKGTFNALGEWVNGKPAEEAFRGHLPENFVLKDAENAPAGSKERFLAAFGTLANLIDVAFPAGVGRTVTKPRTGPKTAPIKSFADLPADLPVAPETKTSQPLNSSTSQPFLADPTIPFMTKVRWKERVKEQLGLSDAEIDPLTTNQISELYEAAEGQRARAAAADQVAEPSRPPSNESRSPEAGYIQAPEEPVLSPQSPDPTSQPSSRSKRSAEERAEQWDNLPVSEREDVVVKVFDLWSNGGSWDSASDRKILDYIARRSFADIPSKERAMIGKHLEENVQRPTSNVQRRSREEIAAEDEYRRALEEEAAAAQAEHGAELLDAIADAGGLPAKEAPSRAAFAGEIRRIDETARDQTRAEKVPLNKLFRNDAPGIDELATRLRDRGFEFQTPGDLLNAVEDRLRTAKPVYGTPASAAAESYASLVRTEMPLPGGLRRPIELHELGPNAGIENPREGRWRAIENSYRMAKAAQEAVPGVPLKDVAAIHVYDKTQGSPGDHPEVGFRFVKRADLQRVMRELDDAYPATKFNQRIGSNHEPYQPRKGEPTFRQWLEGKRPDTEALLKTEQEKYRQKASGEAAAEALRVANDPQLKLFASLAQGTLPRRIQSPTAPNAFGATTGPRTLADIRKYLSTALDIPIRMGTNVAGGMKGAFGLYRVKPQTIRMKALNDIPTIAHEVGHDLHHIVFTDPVTKGPSNFLWGFDGELKPLGRVTSPANATSEYVRAEGVAEFTREWLSDRTAAIAKAPQFTNYFETTLRQQHPEIFQILTNARAQLQAYINQPGWEKAKGMIQWREPEVRTPWRDRLERFYTNWFNELRPIDRAMNKLVELGLDPAIAREVSARAINYRGGWRGKADHDLRFEQTDLNGNRRGKSLHEIVGGIANRQDFETYVALKRAQEKAGQGKTTGFEDALADPETRRKLRDLAPLYEARRQDLIKYSEGLMANMEQSGFFTADQLVAMRQMNRDYVPFYRVYEAVSGQTTGPRGGGDGMVNTSSGVMKFKGSDLQVASPLESIIKNTYMFRDLAERNRIGRQFVDAVEATTGGGRVAESVLKPMKPTQVTEAEVRAKLKDVGLGAEADKLSKAGVDLAMTIFRAADGVSAKDGTFSIWKDGKQKLYQVGDADLLRALTMSDAQITDTWVRLLKPLRKVTSVLRAGATLSPDFILRNWVRDQLTAGPFSRHGFIPFYDGAKTMFSALGKDHWYREWLKHGGANAGLIDTSARSLSEALQQTLKNDPGALRTALDLANPLKVIKNLQDASSIIENATRIAEYRRAIKAGLSPLEAANAAKDVTLNFSRHGQFGQAINSIDAFFNAGLQDVDKVARAHHPSVAGRTIMKSLRWITLPSVLAWYFGKDDDRIRNLPDWRKSYFWNFNLGRVLGDDGADSFVFSFPKPFLMGAIYGSSAERALDYITGRDPNAIQKWGLDLLRNTFLRADLVVAANVFKPLVENIANYSFFTGRRLLNQSQESLEPALQFNPQTSEVAKFIGPKVGTAPIMVDNLVRGYLGSLGRYGTDAIDWFMVKTSLATPAPPPAKSWRELPGIRAFFGSVYAPNEYTGRFYKAMDVAEGRLKTFDAYGNRMMPGEQSRYWEANRNALVWYKAQMGDAETITQLRRVRTQMGDMGKAMVVIQNDRTMDPQTKRERLIYLKDARDKLAQYAFDTYIHPDDRKKVF